MNDTPAITTKPDILYEVFGRLTTNDVLAHVGSLRAPNPDLAEVLARSICGAHYTELCIAPAHCFSHIGKASDHVLVKEF